MDQTRIFADTPFSKSEIRVLRCLPTNLTAPEIASELSVSTSTIKTHLHNLYAKLGAHSRARAIESARAWACWRQRHPSAPETREVRNHPTRAHPGDDLPLR